MRAGREQFRFQIPEATAKDGGKGEVEAETEGEPGQGEAMADTESADETVTRANEMVMGKANTHTLAGSE